MFLQPSAERSQTWDVNFLPKIMGGKTYQDHDYDLGVAPSQ